MRRLLLLACGALFVADLRMPAPAHADPEPGSVLITQSTEDGQLPGVGTVHVYRQPSGSIYVDNPGHAIPVTPECVESQTAQTVCVGGPDQLERDGQPELVVGDTVQGPSVYGGLPEKAIAWIEEEAVDAIEALHGVRGDATVRSYAEPEIRAYVVARLLDILDKRLYGEPMALQETITYQALMEELKDRQLEKAKQVLAEYERWEAGPCTYPVPTPPANGLPVIPNLVAQTQKCRQTSNPYAEASGFVKNTPAVETFERWAGYRNPSPLLAQSGSPEYREMLTSTKVGLGLLGAIGIAAGAGAAAYAIGLAAISVAAAEAITTALGGIGAIAISHGTMAGSIVSVAAGTIAGIVAVTVLALVAIGVSAYFIAQEEQIGQEIRKRVTAAAQDGDPLGIDALRPTFAGEDYTTRTTPPGVEALHRTAAFQEQLAGMVDEWTMLSPAGTFVPDANAGYGSPASRPQDRKFVVNGLARDSVAVQAPPGTVDGQERPVSGYNVHFHDGWLMVSRTVLAQTSPARPSTSVNYTRPDGTAGLMSVVQRVVGGAVVRQFMLTHLEGEHQVAEFSDSWTFLTAGGGSRTATLQEHPPVVPELSLLPTAAGAMTPDGVVTFQSNISEPGAAVTGAYSWVVERLGADGAPVQTWSLGNLTGFQQRFDHPGSYRAKVRFQGTRAGNPVDVRGTVPFAITSPVPRLYSSDLGEPELRDEAVLDGRLALDLRMMQDTPSDATNPEMLHVEVEWADDNRGSKVVRTYDVRCLPVGDGTCETGALTSPAAAPTNPQWSQSPSYRVPEAQRFLPFVTIRVTNDYGASVERTFPMPTDHRPRFADMTPFVELPVGTHTRARVTELVPSDLIDSPPGVDEVTIRPYLEEIDAQLPEGVQAELVEESGRYYVELFGSPMADAIGAHPVVIPAEQEPEGAGWLAAPALATLSVVPSLTPGYRAVLRGVPTFVERHYRTGWPAWYPQVAVRSDVLDDPEFAGDVRCRLTRYGVVVLDQVCDPDQQFPWPGAVTTGDYTASVRAEATPASSGQAVNTAAYAVGFTVGLLDPTLTLPVTGGSAPFQPVTLAVTDAEAGGVVPAPFSARGYAVSCRLDDAAEAPCLDGGSLALSRTPGRHQLRVRVVAPDGAEVVRSATYDVPLVATATSLKARYKPARDRVSVRLGVAAADGASTSGPVRVVLRRGGREVAVRSVSLGDSGVADLLLPKVRRPGRYTVQVTYLGAWLWAPSTAIDRFRVPRPRP